MLRVFLGCMAAEINEHSRALAKKVAASQEQLVVYEGVAAASKRHEAETF